jgi:DNA-binding response OmpR family regulator
MSAKRILVVDDQESMRDMLADLLDMMGYAPRAVAGGAEALHELEAGGIDLVITEVLSSGADGYIPKPCTINRVQETVSAAFGE